MKLDKQTMLGVGINNYSELARKSGLPRQALSAAGNGDRGLSVKSAKAIAPLFGNETPISLYVESQTRAIKAKLDAGGSPTAAQRGGTRVIEQLKKLDPQEMLLEGETLEAALEELFRLIKAAFESATSDANPAATFGETSPASKPKPATKSRDAFGRVAPEADGPVERDVFGRRLRPAYQEDTK